MSQTSETRHLLLDRSDFKREARRELIERLGIIPGQTRVDHTPAFGLGSKNVLVLSVSKNYRLRLESRMREWAVDPARVTVVAHTPKRDPLGF